MSEITLDPDLRARLNGLNQQITVVDEAGNELGIFLPMDAYKALLRNMPIPFSAKEIEQLRNADGGCSLAEIWKRLGVS